MAAFFIKQKDLLFFAYHISEVGSMNLRRMLKTQMERGTGQIEIIPIPQDKRTVVTNLKKLDCLLSFESQRNRMIECRSFVFASNPH